MEDLYSRTEMLIGADGAEKLRRARVLVCGLGGVGGAAFEALVRAGIWTIGVLDGDAFCMTNLNRQILCTLENIGEAKVTAAAARAEKINPDCEVLQFNMFYNDATKDKLPVEQFDCVIDAIDTVSAKLDIIIRAKACGAFIVSSMGTGNKLSPIFELDDIKNTSVCPLARVMRRELKARGIENLTVVYSKEPPAADKTLSENGRHIPGSISYAPAIAGYTAASAVIKKILEG